MSTCTRAVLAMAAAAVVLALPVASACHPPAQGPTTLTGHVVTDDGAVQAELRIIDTCQGPGTETINVTTYTPDGPVYDEVEAQLTVLEPVDGCVGYTSCTPIQPTTTYTIEGEGIGVTLVGETAKGAHLAFLDQVTGTYRGQPATFTTLYV